MDVICWHKSQHLCDATGERTPDIDRIQSGAFLRPTAGPPSPADGTIVLRDHHLQGGAPGTASGKAVHGVTPLDDASKEETVRAPLYLSESETYMIRSMSSLSIIAPKNQMLPQGIHDGTQKKRAPTNNVWKS
jgi:hypothetical protein